MTKTKSKSSFYTELLEIAKVPSPTGSLNIYFCLVGSEDGSKFLAITKRDKYTNRIISAMHMDIKEIPVIAEVFNNISKAMEENK